MPDDENKSITINIHLETYNELKKLQQPGETIEDPIRDLLQLPFRERAKPGRPKYIGNKGIARSEP